MRASLVSLGRLPFAEANAVQSDARLLEAIFDRVPRETRVVLLARKPFFLCRRDDVPVAQQCGGAVVIVGGDTEDGRWHVWLLLARRPNRRRAKNMLTIFGLQEFLVGLGRDDCGTGDQYQPTR